MCSPQSCMRAWYWLGYHIFLLARPEKSPPPPLQAISQDTRDFIQVFNSQQSPSTAENGTSSQYWALKDLTHCYNRSETFHYFQNISLAISHSIISVKCNVWFSKLITNEINEYSWVYWVSIMIRNNLLFWWLALKWPYWPSRKGGHDRWESSWSLGMSWVLEVGLRSPLSSVDNIDTVKLGTLLILPF